MCTATPHSATIIEAGSSAVRRRKPRRCTHTWPATPAALRWSSPLLAQQHSAHDLGQWQIRRRRLRVTDRPAMASLPSWSHGCRQAPSPSAHERVEQRPGVPTHCAALITTTTLARTCRRPAGRSGLLLLCARLPPSVAPLPCSRFVHHTTAIRPGRPTRRPEPDLHLRGRAS